MTLKEAIKVGKILETADNGCSSCISDLVEKANAKFPEFAWTMGRSKTTFEPIVSVKPKEKDNADSV